MTATLEIEPADAILDADRWDVRKYNGKVTIYNPRTGGHRTFLIKTQSADSTFAPGQRVVALLTGPDNQADFQGFGFVSDQWGINVWKSKRGGDFDKFADMLNRPAHYRREHGLEYKAAVKCRRCNRELTDPTSIDSGIGPTCREKL